ncbi:MAG: LytTR family DNA-binding domain-containing protein [Arenicellales bacterium]
MNETIRVLVVDDEPHARRGICALLEDEKDVEVVGEAADGLEAVSRIRKLRPDLVFLDIAMPGRGGMGVIEDVGTGAIPKVVFVTAYERYAIPAFESNAVDYVLKPFTNERFRKAMQRARGTLTLERSLRFTEPAGGEKASIRQDALERFTLKIGNKFKVFNVRQISWIEADDYCVRLHIGSRSHTIRESLSSLENQLPRRHFARIHRSTIVNVEQIDSLEALFQGDYAVILKDGTELRMSRRRRRALAGLIKSFS